MVKIQKVLVIILVLCDILRALDIKMSCSKVVVLPNSSPPSAGAAAPANTPSNMTEASTVAVIFAILLKIFIYLCLSIFYYPVKV